jgi:hypothetical protein
MGGRLVLNPQQAAPPTRTVSSRPREGFSPTPEMPEIVEAQALFKQLAFNDGTASESQTTKN